MLTLFFKFSCLIISLKKKKSHSTVVRPVVLQSCIYKLLLVIIIYLILTAYDGLSFLIMPLCLCFIHLQKIAVDFVFHLGTARTLSERIYQYSHYLVVHCK